MSSSYTLFCTVLLSIPLCIRPASSEFFIDAGLNALQESSVTDQKLANLAVADYNSAITLSTAADIDDLTKLMTAAQNLARQETITAGEQAIIDMAGQLGQCILARANNLEAPIGSLASLKGLQASVILAAERAAPTLMALATGPLSLGRTGLLFQLNLDFERISKQSIVAYDIVASTAINDISTQFATLKQSINLLEAFVSLVPLDESSLIYKTLLLAVTKVETMQKNMVSSAELSLAAATFYSSKNFALACKLADPIINAAQFLDNAHSIMAQYFMQVFTQFKAMMAQAGLPFDGSAPASVDLEWYGTNMPPLEQVSQELAMSTQQIAASADILTQIFDGENSWRQNPKDPEGALITGPPYQFDGLKSLTGSLQTIFDQKMSQIYQLQEIHTDFTVTINQEKWSMPPGEINNTAISNIIAAFKERINFNDAELFMEQTLDQLPPWAQNPGPSPADALDTSANAAVQAYQRLDLNVTLANFNAQIRANVRQMITTTRKLVSKYLTYDYIHANCGEAVPFTVSEGKEVAD